MKPVNTLSWLRKNMPKTEEKKGGRRRELPTSDRLMNNMHVPFVDLVPSMRVSNVEIH